MSAGAEQELRQRLGSALDEITPGPAPVTAVIRRGRAVRRRRTAGAVALALLIAAALAGPAWLGLRSPSLPPVAPGSPAVTVNPPGPGAPPGLIASGTVGSRAWRASVTPPRHGSACLVTVAGRDCVIRARPGSPVDLQGGYVTPGYLTLAGPVQPQVTRVDVLLGDGEQLTLQPVAAYGSRWVAFALPYHMKITRVEAYAGRAVYRYTIPFNGPPAQYPSPKWGSYLQPEIITWLRPGAPVPHRQTFRIVSGTARRPVLVIELTGPWGRCIVQLGTIACLEGQGPEVRPGQLIQPLGSAGVGTEVFLAEAAPRVASLELRLSDGQRIRVITGAGSGGQRFYSYAARQGAKVLRWTAYGADGKRLGSGTGATNG
jgi:hypothetical protein